MSVNRLGQVLRPPVSAVRGLWHRRSFVLVAVIATALAYPGAMPAGAVVTPRDGLGVGVPAKLTAPMATCNPANQLGGVVFRDYNANGLRDAREPFLGAVQVRAYGASGALLASAQTDWSDGAYALNIPPGTEVRVEFDWSAAFGSFFQEGVYGPQSLTSVTFATSPNCSVGLALARYAEYCPASDASIKLVTAKNMVGSAQHPTVSTYPAAVSFPYSAGGAWPNRFEPPPTAEATFGQIGATYGVAYQRRSNNAFFGAFLKRHSGLGPGGTGAIYRVDLSAHSGSLFVDLNALGFATGANPHPAGIAIEDWLRDAASWDAVGKVGLGDLEMSDDDTVLWAVNLYTRSLLRIPVGLPPTPPTAAQIQSYSLLPFSPGNCPEPNVNFRPMGLGKLHDQIFVGAVCSAESTQNTAHLRGYVYRFDNPGFSLVLDFPFTYDRTAPGKPPVTGDQFNWQPWTPTFQKISLGVTDENGQIIEGTTYPEPWIGDIDFDNGSMVIGVRDRYGDQIGWYAYSPNLGDDRLYWGETKGDFLRACPTASNTWTLENNATSCSVTTGGHNQGQGPGGGEYYFQEGNAWHSEVGEGAVAQVPGRPDFVGTAYDAAWEGDQQIQAWSQGVLWLHDTLGTWSKGYLIVVGGRSYPDQPYFGKASGLADLEAACAPAPIEIGNRVWLDENKNGIQDAGSTEAPIAGVTVSLYDMEASPNVPLAQTQTSSEGEYYFHSRNVAGGLRFGRRYEVRLDNPADTAQGGPLYGLRLTRADQGSSDIRDSDGRLKAGTLVTLARAKGSPEPTVVQQQAGGVPYAPLQTGGPGENNHSFDFGFIRGDVSIYKRDWPDPVWAGQELFYEVRVCNGDETSPATGVVVTDTLPAGLIFLGETDNCDVIPGGGPNGEDLLVCQLPDVPPQGCVDFEIKMRVPANFVALEVDGTIAINNHAELSAGGGDTEPSDNVVDEGTFVEEQADLRITKMVKPDASVRAGELFTYTVWVENLGPSYARNVSIRDDLLSSGRFQLVQAILDPNRNDAGPYYESAPQGGVTMRFDLLDPLEPVGWGGNGRWLIQLVVRANETQDVNNRAIVYTRAAGQPPQPGTPDPDTSNNEATVFLAVLDTADLSVTKAGPANVTAGGTIQWTLTVRNSGPSTAANAVVRDVVPYGVAVSSATVAGGGGSCTLGTSGDPGNPLTCGLDSIPVGGVRTITIVGTVSPSVRAGQSLANSVWVYSDDIDPNNANNYAASWTLVLGSVDLSLSKSAQGPFPWLAGELRSYQYFIANAGPSVARDVVLTDPLPAQLEFVSAWLGVQDESGGAPIPCQVRSDRTVVCAIGDVAVTPAGAPLPRLVMTVRVRSDTPHGTVVTNTAVLTSSTTESNSSNNQSSSSVTAERRADLSIDKRATDYTPVAGEELVYAISVTNAGPSDAQNVVVTDSLPGGLTYVLDSDSCAEGPPGTLTCALGNMPVGATRSFEVLVRVAANALPGGILTNPAAVTSLTIDPNSGNNSDDADVAPRALTDLRVLKFGKPDKTVRAGEELEYTIVVDNLGPSYAHGVELRDEIVANGQFDLVSVDADVIGNRPTASCVPSGPINDVNERLTLRCNPGAALEPFGPPNLGRWVVAIVVRADEDMSIDDVASVSDTDVDPDERNNQAIVEHEITAVADLAVRKTDSPDPATAGQTVSWQITVTNAGPSPATNTILIDDLPPGVLYGSATAQAPATGVCAISMPGNRLQCALDTIAAGGTVTVLVTGTVDTDVPAGTVLHNSVLVTSNSYDGDNSDNFGASQTTVRASADIVATKSDTPDPVLAGKPLSYTVDVTNRGPSLARQVVLVDTLPAAAIFVSAAVTNGTGGESCAYSPGAHTVTCTLGDLPLGESRQVQIEVTVDPTTPSGTNIVNEADITALTSDPDPSNNTDILAVTRVQAASDLAIFKSLSDPTPVAGGTVAYTIRVVNRGPSTARAVTVVDTLPTGFTAINQTDACAPVPGAGPLTCNLGDMAAGEERSFTITARIDPALQPSDLSGQLALNRAVVSSSTADPEPANNSATSTAHVRALSDLKVTKYGKPDGRVRAGETLTYTIIVDNLGPSYGWVTSLKDVIESSGRFQLVGLQSDRTAACTYSPDGGQPSQPPASVLGRLQIDCTLDQPLALLAATGYPNPGRWILTAVLQATEEQSINNTVDVLAAGRDPDYGNNHAAVQHEITEIADLSVEKQGPATAVAGEEILYTVEVTNWGPSTAENVLLYDRLPPGLTVVGATAEGGSCSTGTPGQVLDQVRCGLGSLAVNEVRMVTIAALLDPGLPAGTVLENDVFVVSDSHDDDNGDNFGYVLTEVESVADLEVTKTAEPSTAVAGEPLEYVITVTNEGSSDAANVLVIDTLPAGTHFVSAAVIVGQGSCSGQPTGKVTCQLGTLPAGDWAQISVIVMVDPSYDCDAGALINQVTATSTSDPEGAEFELQTPIVCPADLVVQKWSYPVKVYAGEQKKYTVRVTNLGPADAENVVLTDTLPSQVEYETNNRGCSIVRGEVDVVTCSLGGLAVDASFEVDIYALVDADTPPGTTIRNTAEVTSDTEERNEADNTAFAENLVLQKADLKIEKFGKPDGQVRAGEVLTYTLVVDNLGPSWANGVSVKDLLQSSGRFDLLDVTSDRAMSCSSTPSGAPGSVSGINQRLLVDCTLANPLEVLTATGDAVNPGRWLVTMRLRALQNQDINNVAHLTTSAYDPDESNNTARAMHEITAVADLSLIKSGPRGAIAGTSATYDLTVVNNGPSTAENVILYDRLPPGVWVTSVVASQGTCSTGTPGLVADRLTCGLGSIGPQGTVRVTVTVGLDPSLTPGSLLENDALVTSDNYDPWNANNFATVLTLVDAESLLEVSKTDSIDPVVAGTEMEYLLTITNRGPSTAHNVSVRDSLPPAAYVTYLGYHIGNGAGTCFYQSVSNEVDCYLGDLLPGTFREIYLHFLVLPSTPDGTVLNDAMTVLADSSITVEGDTTEQTTVEAEADLVVTKTSDPVKVYAGEQKKYVVRVTNLGPSDALAVTVVDTLPAEVEYEIDTGLCRVTRGEPDVVTCDAGRLEPGASFEFAIWARVDPDTLPDTVLVNTAVATSETSDPAPDNNTAESRNLVLEKADLKVVKFGKPDGEVRAGEVLTYTVIVDNLGPSWATGVSLKDVLQSSGRFDLLGLESDRPMSCSSTPSGAPGPVLGINQRLLVDCTLSERLEVLEASGEAVNPGRWILTMRVRARQTQDINNAAQITSAAYDPDPANNSAFVVHAITDVADLSVTKTGPGSIVAGTSLTYELVVTNLGPSRAENVVLYDRLPPGLTVTGWTASQGSCTTGTAGDATDKLTCGLGFLDAGAQATVQVTAFVDPSLTPGSILENDAFVSGDIFDPTNANNYASWLTTVAAASTLYVTKIDEPDPVVAGEELEYALTVVNNGPSTAHNVFVFDSLPPPQYVTFLGYSIGNGTGSCFYQATFNEVDCYLGDILPGSFREIYLRFLVAASTPDGTVLTDTALWQADSPITVEGDTEETTTVQALADLVIEKLSDPVKVNAGEQKKYTVKVTNLGPSDALAVFFTDTLPTAADYEIDTGLCQVSLNSGPNGEDVVTCQLGRLVPGQSRSVDIYALVEPATPAGTTLVNEAVADSSTVDPEEANNTVRAENFVLQKADLAITKFGKPDGEVRAGEILTYTVIVDNLGPSWATGVAVKDVLQSSGKWQLLGVASDRPMSCSSLPAGAPGGIAVVDQRLQIDCRLTGALEAISAESGPPNAGRWVLTIRVTAPETQDINNVAQVTNVVRLAGEPSAGNLALDPDASNNVAYVEHDITDVADLAVTKTALGEVVTGCSANNSVIGTAANRVVAGRQLFYTIVVTNNGPSTADNTLLYDRLPPGVTLVGGTINGDAARFTTACRTGTAGDAADQLVCGLGSLPPVGSNRTVTIGLTVRVRPDLAAGSILENDVQVRSEIYDPTTANDFAHNLTTVETSADLRLVKAHDPATATAGELLRYTLMVTNDGPSVAKDVHVYDDLPAQVTYVGATGGTCIEDPVTPGNLVCSVGDMAPGETRYIYVVVLVHPDAPGTIVNTAVAQSGFSDDTPVPGGVITPDPCPADNQASDSTTVIRVVDVWARKSDLTDPVVAGTEARYRIDFGNNGPSTATNVQVRDTLPAGFSFDRCEPIDPNDTVACSVTGQTVTLLSIKQANAIVFSDGGVLDPGKEFGFYIVADVSPGYILDGQSDAEPGPPPEVCYPYFAATGYPYWAHDRIEITADQDRDLGAQRGLNNWDDECTRVEALADLEILKLDDLAGFMECDPVAPGGHITYDIFIKNNGPSDAAQVYLVDWLPSYGVVLDPAFVKVTVADGRGQVVEIRDDGRITVVVGTDPNAKGQPQLGRLNVGSPPVQVTIEVEVIDKPDVCGLDLLDVAIVETRRNDSLWPPIPGASFAPTPTPDPDLSNNRDEETTRVECPAVEVEKSISFNGECPGTTWPVVVKPGSRLTFCIRITNVGTTYLDNIRLVDRLVAGGFVHEVFTDTIRYGADPRVPVAPGETVWRKIDLPAFCHECECGRMTDLVEVIADPVNLGRTPYPCLPDAVDRDEQELTLPCSGVGSRLLVPVLSISGQPAPPPVPLQEPAPLAQCTNWIQVQNVGRVPTKAMLVLWGEPGACPPQSVGPLKTECSGLLRPGSAWSFAPTQLPEGARSGIVYSLNATDMVLDERGNRLPFADLACLDLFRLIAGSHGEWLRFDEAYRNGGIYYGPIGAAGQQLQLDFGAHQGEPLAVVVNRSCPDPSIPGAVGNAAYKAISADLNGMPDPHMGGYMYYAPMIISNKGGLTSWIHIQNAGIQCSSLELWFKDQENCLRPVLGDVLSLAPGESLAYDAQTVLGADWLGSMWIRASQPLGVVVDTVGANHFTSYIGVPSDVYLRDSGQTFSLGTQVNYAPLIYNQHQGWDTALIVQNLSSTVASKVKVYFLDQSGGIVFTLVDWICPRGSQTFFLPVIDALPGNWIGSARIESQEWWTPGDPMVDPPRLQTVVLLEKWADPARSSRREAVAYNAATECDAYDWQIGAWRGGVQSGSAVLAIPLLAKQNRGVTTELAITNLVPKPGFTDFAIYVYDQNGLLDVHCEKLNEKQVEYIDLNTWGWISRNFLGSAVISAVYWEHDVLDASGQFLRNVVGLGAVMVERVGGLQGQPDVPGDESKAVEAFPLYDVFHTETRPECPGIPRVMKP